MTLVTPLRVLVFQGSTRVMGPPQPARVGDRVVKWVSSALIERGHQVEIVDPVETDLPLLQKPHFAYASGRAPEALESLAAAISDSQAYVMCTPEYNHAPSPALLNTINHFGSSLFSFKPSAIVSYSQGQWGGTRAALALRAPLRCARKASRAMALHIRRAMALLLYFDVSLNSLLAVSLAASRCQL